MNQEQRAAEIAVLDLLILAVQASRVTRNKDLNMVEALIRQERSLQAQRDALAPHAKAA